MIFKKVVEKSTLKEIKKGPLILILVSILLLTSYCGCLDNDNSNDKEIVEEEDKTPPTINIIDPKENDLLEGKIKIKVDVEDESEVRLAFYIDDGLKQNDYKRYYNWDTTTVDDGEHTIKVIAIDESENQAVDSITVKTDNTPNELPEIIINSPSKGEIVNNQITIEGEASDDSKIEKVEIKIGNEWNLATDDSSDWQTWSYDWQTTGEGYREITIKATDDEGGITEEKITVKVDNLPPLVEITSPENEAIINSEIEIETDINDFSEIENIEIYLDYNLIYTGEPTILKLDTLDFEDGFHTIKVTGTDIVGNSKTTTIEIEIDNTPPTIDIENLVDDSFVKGIVNIEVDAFDTSGMEKIEIYIDDEFIQIGENYEWNTLIYYDGEHEIKVIAMDDLSNEIVEKIAVNIDNTAPTIEIEDLAPLSWVNDIITINANVNDDGLGIKYIAFFVDDTVKKNGTDYSFDWNTNQYNNGEHEITIICSDYLENFNKLSMNLNVDNSPPTFDISSPKNNEFVKELINIEITNITDDGTGAGFEDSISFFIDDVLLMKMSPGFNNKADCEIDTNKYDDGKHTIKVEIIDGTGNKKMKSININIDNTKPLVEIKSPKERELLAGKVKIDVDANDEGSGIKQVLYYIDNEIKMIQSSGNYIYNWNSSVYKDGEHEIFVIVFDNVDNYNVYLINITIDNTPPEIEIVKPGADSKVHDIVTIDVNIMDMSGIDFIEFLIDDKSVQKDKKESYEWNTTKYDEGEHEIEIIAEDELGNRNQEEITVSVDNINPMHVDITEPHNNEAVRGGIRIKAEVETGEGAEVDYITFYIDDQSKQNSTQSNYQWNTKSFTNGLHKILVEGGDTNGNSDKDTIEVIVDNNKPTIEITKPNDDEIVSDKIIIDVDAEDEHSGIKYIDFQIDEISIQNDTKASCNLDTINYEDGEHKIKVFVSDKAGNYNQDEITIIVDNTPPIVKIINPNIEWVKGTINIEVDVVEEGSGIEYIDFKIKGESKQNSTKENYEWNTKNHEDGIGYEIEVKAGDKVGNTNNSTIIVGVDNTPPDLKITTPTSSNPYVKRTFRIETDAFDATSGPDNMSFSINDLEKQISLKQWYDWNTTFYSDGWHKITVTVWDKAQNSITKEVNAYVDNTMPTLEITYPENNAELEEEADEYISVNANDDESGLEKVEFYIDEELKYEVENEPYKYEFNTKEIGNGWHDIDVYSYDKAGNTAKDTIKVKIGDVPEPIVKDPHTNWLGNGYNVQNAERINVNDYMQVPILSSLVKRGITPSLGWNGSKNPKTDFDVPGGDGYSIYSGKMALSYWDKPQKAIVVDNYEHALLLSQYAAVKDYPIIVYQGNKQMTDEALYKLETVWADQIIVCGNTPYNSQGVKVLNENEVLEYTIDAAKFEGIDLEYITVVNPNDIEGQANTAHLSSFGGVFSAFHNGILLECPPSSIEMNSKIHEAVDLLNTSGMEVKYICILGDQISMPFDTNGQPSDNPYGDLDGNIYTMEIAVGRIIAKELGDLSYYADRIINYNDYLDTQNAPLVPVLGTYGSGQILCPDWNNNAIIYMGTGAEYLSQDSENAVRNYLYLNGHFNTQDDTPVAYNQNRPVLMADFAISDFIMINADHGSPTGTVSFSSGDLIDMHPGVCFGTSCSVGRIDGVNKGNSLTYTFLEKGMNSWFGPTRTTYGSVGPTYPYNPQAATGLCYYFNVEVISNDLTTGEALKEAKNDLIAHSSSSTNKTVVRHYIHYGDPGFNPYEPNNEGA